ncbi:MAG: hypothetical protein HY053_06090 [Proteobacteria bacterium]|nr:hypothetical protein [Pseudomonadota bacterium]
MFLFAFTLVLFAIVGLFFQVVNALALYLASQQLGMGGQLFLWQNLATQYACAQGVPQTGTIGTSDSSVTNGIRSMRAEYQGNNWNTVIFDGAYGTTAARMVFSYISPATSYGGLSSAEVIREFRQSFRSNDFRFGPAYVAGCSNQGCMNVIVYNTGTPYSVVASGIPITGPDAVPDGVVGIVNGVSCP